eukprot:4214162-Pyramimonas_sp.AAC.1
MDRLPSPGLAADLWQAPACLAQAGEICSGRGAHTRDRAGGVASSRGPGDDDDDDDNNDDDDIVV